MKKFRKVKFTQKCKENRKQMNKAKKKLKKLVKYNRKIPR